MKQFVQDKKIENELDVNLIKIKAQIKLIRRLHSFGQQLVNKKCYAEATNLLTLIQDIAQTLPPELAQQMVMQVDLSPISESHDALGLQIVLPQGAISIDELPQAFDQQQTIADKVEDFKGRLSLAKQKMFITAQYQISCSWCNDSLIECEIEESHGVCRQCALEMLAKEGVELTSVEIEELNRLREEKKKDQSGSDGHIIASKPKKVKEIADAIRRDDPKVSDEKAYKMSWETYCSYVNPSYKGCTEKGKSKRKS